MDGLYGYEMLEGGSDRGAGGQEERVVILPRRKSQEEVSFNQYLKSNNARQFNSYVFFLFLGGRGAIQRLNKNCVHAYMH